MSIWKRPRKDGTLVYYWRIVWRGKVHRGYIGPVSKRTAQAEDRKAKVQIAEGHYHPAPAPAVPTLQAFSPRFLDWYEQTHRPASWIRYEERLRLHLLPYLGALPMQRCTEEAVDSYVAARSKEGAKAWTINGELVTLLHVLNKAAAWKVISRVEVPHVTKLRIDERAYRTLSPAEESALMLVASERLRDIITVGLHTGMRKMELTTLTWQEVDWSRREIVVTAIRAKSRRERRIPMTETVYGLLSKLRPTPEDLSARVFSYRDWTDVFESAVKRAGLRGVTPHTLRHSFGTRALEAGCNIRSVQRWLGHSSITMTEKYIHPSTAHEHEAIRVLDHEPNYHHGHLIS